VEAARNIFSLPGNDLPQVIAKIQVEVRAAIGFEPAQHCDPLDSCESSDLLAPIGARTHAD